IGNPQTRFLLNHYGSPDLDRMCGKISVLAARGLQTCDAQALTTDCTEGSRTGGSETHHYEPTGFRNPYTQPHASACTKTLPLLANAHYVVGSSA
ncbi:hypothetical protein, partial [Corynebacterium diphtheriae]|uniref:hypothetical protein n=1 Tax=Corynebacterium diphtheriae TaxID=1717 RepID=UPI000A239732